LLLSKRNCSPCTAAKFVLNKICDQLSLTYATKFIERDPKYRPLYGNKVPVVLINDVAICEMGVDRQVILDAIRKA
jgi:glutaredoxin